MAPDDRTLIRFAIWIHEQLSARRPQISHVSPPTARFAQVEALHRRLAYATERGWRACIASLQSDLRSAITGLGTALDERICRFDEDKIDFALPTARGILDELKGLRDEFDSVEFDLRQKQIRITTEPIVLEELSLGPFQIELDFKRKSNGLTAGYRVIAIEPNPAASNSSVTHPHVHSDTLCEGDGHMAIYRALASGRLYDFFMVVANVLRSYNPSSPHVSIAQWLGIKCEGCGDTVREDDSSYCSRCESTFCGDCSNCCNDCDSSFCSDCMSSCPGCHERVCSGCLSECKGCETEYCSRCLKQERCNACETETNEESPDGSDDSNNDTADSDKCHAAI